MPPLLALAQANNTTAPSVLGLPDARWDWVVVLGTLALVVGVLLLAGLRQRRKGRRENEGR